MKQIYAFEHLNFSHSDRVLIIMPHPDDEAAFCCGLMQKLVKANIAVKLVTCTCGENSTLRFGLHEHDDLAECRKKELTQAMKLIGLTDISILDFPDGGLESKRKQLLESLKQITRDFKPTLCVTLEPDGIYGHPDHIALTQITEQLAQSSLPLLYATVSPNCTFPFAKHMAKKDRVLPLAPDICLHLTPREGLKKIRSLYSHQSQFSFHPKQFALFFSFLQNGMFWNEYFTYKK